MNDKNAARQALQLLRNTLDVEQELNEIERECLHAQYSQAGNSNSSLKDILKSKQLRWPILIACLLNMGQQLSGVNAVPFFNIYIHIYSYIYLNEE